MKLKEGQKVKYQDKEWTVLSNDPSEFYLTRKDEQGWPIIERVEDIAKIIIITYSVWEPIKKIITDIINFFRKKR
jgi:hypothetical protein